MRATDKIDFAAKVTTYKRAYRRVLQVHSIMMQGQEVVGVSDVLAASMRAERDLSPSVAEDVRKSVDAAFGLLVE